ncbi:MAG: O-antigen ligase family protein [Patescibacteria group bacterium]|nr:O-antigen ligase family protein [Patescibacteria group bacterium]
MKKILEKIIEYLFYLFVFTFVWQTKLIIVPAETNYNEIALYFNYLLLALILIIFIFYFFKYKRNEAINNFDFAKYWVALAGMEFFIFLSIFASSVRAVSIFKYILFLLSFGLLFLMTQFKFNFKKIILIFLSALLFQASLGIFQFFSQKSFSNKYLGIASHEASVLGVSVLENDLGRFVRAYGATDHPNVFGALMFFAIFFVILLLVIDPYLEFSSLNNKVSSGFKEGERNKKYRGRKILFYFVLLIFIIALMVSFSRSAFLALGLSLIFLFLTSLFNKNSFKKYYPIFIFCLTSILLFFIIFKPLIVNRFKLSSRLEKISISERSEQIGEASKIIKSNPWLGVGLGAYHNKVLELNPTWESYQAQPVHNTFLLSLAEIGLWGFILFLLFIFYIIKKNVLQVHYFPLFIGIFVFMAFDHWLWSLPFGLLFMFFLFGLTFYFKYDKVHG